MRDLLAFRLLLRPLMALAILMASLAGLAVPQPALADEALIDFESFTAGTVNAQGGWSSAGAAGSGCAVYDHAVTDVDYGYAEFGTQSLRISNAVTSGCFGDQTFSASLADEAGESSAEGGGLSGGTRQPYFEAEWQFASTVPDAEQTGLTLVASPDRGDGARMSWVQMADGPDGLAVNFYDYQAAVANFVLTPVASGLDRTVPHTIKITMEFVDGAANDIVKLYVDGSLVHTGTSWEDYFRDSEANPTRTVDSLLFRTSGTAVPATAGNGFLIDNLRLFSGPLPDPAAPTVDIVDVTPDPRNGAVDSVEVLFSESVSGVDLADFSLTLDGDPLDLSGASVTGGGAAYTIGGLEAVTSETGEYQLTLTAAGSGIVDSANNALASDADEIWRADLQAPIADIVDITPDPRTFAVDVVEVEFSEPVSGVDLGDFTLSRNPINRPNQVTVVFLGSALNVTLTPAADGRSYTISGLSGLTNNQNNAFSLTLNAAGSDIADALGNALAESESDSWERLRPLNGLTLRDGCVIATETGFEATFDYNNPNSVAVEVPVGPFNRFVALPASLPQAEDRGQPTVFEPGAGSFTVAFEGGRLRWVLNGQSALANSNQVCDYVPPTADIVDVTPDPRVNGVASIEVVFSESVVGLDLADFSLTRDGLPVDLAGARLTLTLDGAVIAGLNARTRPVGEYTLTLVAEGSEITDGSGNALLEDASDTWTRRNRIPRTVDDVYTVDEDTTLSVDAPGVLGNDSDADGHDLAAELVDAPANGALELAADGSFVYTPEPDFNGEDGFSYVAVDGFGNSAVTQVTITVSGVNDLAVAVEDSYATDEDTPLSVDAPGVLGNDSEADGDLLTAVLVDGPAHGTLELAADGSFVYTPEADFNGEDSFSYAAADSFEASAPATVSITVSPVNDAPVAVADSYTTDEDTALTVATLGVLDNDSDIDGDLLSAILVEEPANGSLILDVDGGFVYTPNADFFGSDSFVYAATDGADDSDAVTVSITVEAVNDAPVAEDDSYTVDEDTTLTVAAPGVLGNDGDVEEDALTAMVVAEPANGSLVLNEDGSFVYTPGADFEGSDSFSYVAFDGTVASEVATVSITVNPVNDAPSLRIDVSGGRCLSSEAARGSLALAVADVEAGDLSLTSSSSNPRVRVALRGAGAERTVVLSVTSGAPTSGLVTLTLTDGEGLASSLEVRVTAGSRRGDWLQGTAQADVIFGLDGNDRITGAGGSDLLCGGDGHDDLQAGDDDDYIDAGDGHDYALGGNGDDYVYGRDGKDTIEGGDGDDRLSAGDGNDSLRGGAGDDVMTGGRGYDFFDGGPDTDSITDFSPRQGDMRQNVP